MLIALMLSFIKLIFTFNLFLSSHIDFFAAYLFFVCSNIEWKCDFLAKNICDDDCCRCFLACFVSSTLHEIAWAFGASPRTPPDPQFVMLRPRPTASCVGHCLQQWISRSSSLQPFSFFFFQGPITCMRVGHSGTPKLRYPPKNLGGPPRQGGAPPWSQIKKKSG